MIAGMLEVQMMANVARLAKDMNEAKRHVSGATSAIEKSAQVARKALGAIGAALSIREVIQYADTWKQVENQLKQVTDTETGMVRVRDQLFAVSKSTNAELSNTVNLYSELYRATRELNVSENEVVDVTKTINNLFLAGGKAASETAGAIRQLTQGLASGALRGDEFNSVAEGAPRILDAIAASTGMARGELREFAATGGITSEILVTALQEYQDEAQRMADMTERTFSQKLTNAKTNLTAFVGESDLATGAVNWLGSAIETLSEWLSPASRFVSDLGSAFMVGLNPFLVDAEFFVRALLAGFSNIRDTLATAKTGFAGLDNVVNTFFSNSQSGAVSTAELFQLSFGTIIPNAVAGFQAGTVAVADAYFRLKTIITLSGKEEEQALMLLNNARSQSINEIMAGRDAQLNALYDLVSAQADERKSIQELIDSQDDLTASNKDSAGSVQRVTRLTAEQVKELEKAREKADDYIDSLREKLNATEMSARAAAIYNAVMKVGTDATAAQTVEAATYAAQLWDLEDAQDAVKDAAAELAKETERSTKQMAHDSEIAAKQMADDWADTRESFGDFFADMVEDGESAFDSLLKSFKRMLLEMAGQLALSGLMKAFGVSVPGGASSGMQGILESSGMAGTLTNTVLGSSLLGGGVSQFVGGMTGTAVGTGASTIVGAPTAAAAAGSGLSASLGALATNPATWAIAALVYAASQDFWKDPDGYKRSFAGLLTAPTPGATGSTFAVDPFASGFNAQGIAHNADRSTATQYIDTFRSMDASITDLVGKLGGTVDLSKATLGGVGMEGQLGSDGTFLGMGGKTTEADIAGMVNLYVSQMAKHITGLDADLLKAVQSASTAEDAVKLLSDAMADAAEVAVAVQIIELTNMEKAQNSASASIVSAYEGGITELDSIRRAYKAFEGFAERGLTAGHIAKFTGLMESEIQSVLDRGALLNAPAANSASSGSTSSSFDKSFDLWGATARNAYTPDPEFKAAIEASFLANGMNKYGEPIADGSHFNGINSVPFDGYRAVLHRGEEVNSAAKVRSRDVASESMLAEMRSLVRGIQKVADSSKKTSDLLTRVTRDGDSLVTAAA